MMYFQRQMSSYIGTDENVDVKYVVDVMDIAQRNKYQVVLATRGK